MFRDNFARIFRALLFAALTGPDADADALMAAHLDLMRAQSPAESCHVMTADALRASGARVFLGRDADGEALAIRALKPLGEGAAELKSMHCRQDRRGQGLGRALLDRLVAEACATGLTRLWLETGSAAPFAPARALYAAAGFIECPPFGDYIADPLGVFMSRAL